MKKSFFLLLFFLIFGCSEKGAVGEQKSQSTGQKGRSEEVKSMLKNIKWFGHASFKITGEKVIYIDPFQLSGKEVAKDADIILVTHTHHDHLSPDDIAKIQKVGTVIVVPRDGESQVTGTVKTVKPDTVLTVDGIKIETVPAYNVSKQFHPRSNGWVGYIVTVNNQRIYHAGDTDFIPEMKNIKTDIALVPIGGKYTMDAVEAAQAVNTFKPKLAIPMHWGSIIGDKGSAEKFKSLCKVDVEIMTKAP